MMKKALFFCITIMFSLNALAQQRLTSSNHSLSYSATVNSSFQYTYEQRIGGTFTVLFSGGVMAPTAYVAFSGDGGFGWSVYDIGIHIGVEPRYYYNLGWRERKGRITNSNSANFFSVEGRMIPLGFFSGETGFIVSPLWGLRRVYDNGFLLEVKTGLDLYNIYIDGVGLHIELKVGYKF